MFKNKGLFKSQSESQAEDVNQVEENEVQEPVVDGQSEGLEKEPIADTGFGIGKPDVALQDGLENEAADRGTMKVELSAEDAARYQSLRSKMVSASFGEIVTLLMRSPHYRHYSLADLEWLVVPPLLTNQFLVVEAQMMARQTNSQAEAQDSSVASAGLDIGKSGGDEKHQPEAQNKDQPEASTKSPQPSGVRIPVGMALWAKVSPEVDAKLSENLTSPIKLRPDEWRSGEINWLIEIFGDEKIMQGLYEKLKNDVFKGETFKVRAQSKDGKKFVKEVAGGSGDIADEGK